jgi:hypothetical protein
MEKTVRGVVRITMIEDSEIVNACGLVLCVDVEKPSSCQIMRNETTRRRDWA